MKLEDHEYRVLSKNDIRTAIVYPVKTFNHEQKQIKDIFQTMSRKMRLLNVPFLRKY